MKARILKSWAVTGLDSWSYRILKMEVPSYQPPALASCEISHVGTSLVGYAVEGHGALERVDGHNDRWEIIGSDIQLAVFDDEEN